MVPLANECCKALVFVQQSTIQHEKAETGVFSGRDFEKKSVTVSYYRGLAYADL